MPSMMRKIRGIVLNEPTVGHTLSDGGVCLSFRLKESDCAGHLPKTVEVVVLGPQGKTPVPALKKNQVVAVEGVYQEARLAGGRVMRFLQADLTLFPTVA